MFRDTLCIVSFQNQCARSDVTLPAVCLPATCKVHQTKIGVGWGGVGERVGGERERMHFGVECFENSL